MTTAAVLREIKALTRKERFKVYDALLAVKTVREDLLDLLTLELRRKEHADPIDKVFKRLGIKA